MPVHFEGKQIVVRPSGGIAFYPEQGRLAAELVSKADAAMYKAKKTSGGPGWAFYDAAMPPSPG
jgi:GGDEF domain-containing protein